MKQVKTLAATDHARIKRLPNRAGISTVGAGFTSLSLKDQYDQTKGSNA